MAGWRDVYAYKLGMGGCGVTNKTVMITGSSKGLGKSLAFAFASGGYDMILHGRNKARLEDIQTDIVLKYHVDCPYIIGDITSIKTIGKLYVIALEKELDIFINNAAIYDVTPFGWISLERIKDIIDTNLTAPIILSNRMLHTFIQNRKGLIININSIAGKYPDEKEAVYCASKCGLRSFSKSIKYKALQNNIRILDIYLGAMQTDMVKDRPDYDKFIDPDEAARFIFTLSQNTFDNMVVKEVEIGRTNY